MPVSTAVDAYPRHPLGPGGAQSVFRAAVLPLAAAELTARHYRVASVIDQDGRYSVGRPRQAMTAAAVAETEHAVEQYTAGRRRSPRAAPELALPHPLGRETGSDATLFIGGEGYAGDEEADPADLLRAMALLELTVGAVDTVAAANSRGTPLERTARAVDTAAQHASNAAYYSEEADRLDPIRYPRSRLRLTMTLVDNETGYVLWHVDRAFHYDPSNPTWIRRAFEVSIRHLPCGDAPARTSGAARARRHNLQRPCRPRR